MLSKRLLRGVALAVLFLALTGSLPAQQFLPTKPPAQANNSYLLARRGCRTLDVDLPSPPYSLNVDEEAPGCGMRPRQPDAPLRQACGPGFTQDPRCGGQVDESLPPGLEVLGKKKQPILAARAKVLDILESENACTEWFRTRNPNPALVFRTLSFAVDSKAVEYVVKRQETAATAVYVNPYVANVTQDGGEFQTITLNAGGAFFRPSATLIKRWKEGGPEQLLGAHTLKVGPYLGNTREAQVITLLHELGHLEGLLPIDTDDVDGRSAANTREVLRHCQSEIESTGKRKEVAALH
jgi:hypothetical protein